MNSHIVEPLEHSQAATLCTVGDYLVRLHAPRCAYSYAVRLDPARMKQALSRVITDYSLFSGRLKLGEGSIQVLRGRGGVIFEVAERTETIAELREAANVNPSLIAPRLDIKGALRGLGPVFAARLTHAADGSIVGATWHHSVGDYQSVMLLLTAWAAAYRGEPYALPVELDDRDAYLAEKFPDVPGESDLRVARFTDLSRMLLAGLAGGRRVTLHFQSEDLGAMRAAASRERSVSQDDALWAHVAMALRKLRRSEQPSKLMMTINFRGRMGMPETLMGNMTGIVTVPIEADCDVAQVAARLRAGIGEPSVHHYAYHPTQRFAREHASDLHRKLYFPKNLDPLNGNFLISSIVRFPFEQLMFEPDAPIQHTFGMLTEKPLFSALAFGSPPSTGNGREVTLWIPRRLARRLNEAGGSSYIVGSPAKVATEPGLTINA